MNLLTNISIALAVASAWLGCLGFMRLHDPLDRLHCVTFCNIVGGFLVLMATLFSDGLSSRSLKVMLIWVIGILAGAATSHATGRGIVAREEEA